MVDNYLKCGFIITDDDEISEVYGFTNSNGYTSLYFNNDPYGLVLMDGLQNVEIEELGDAERQISRMLAKQERGIARGIILLKGSLLIIRDVESFEAEIQPLEVVNGSCIGRPLGYYVDVADLDEDCDEYERVASLFNII